MEKETGRTTDYFQSSFNAIIRIQAILECNQIVQARILSLLKNTPFDDEKQAISKLTSEFESALRQDIFGDHQKQ